jgi:hypothetical protein
MTLALHLALSVLADQSILLLCQQAIATMFHLNFPSCLLPDLLNFYHVTARLPICSPIVFLCLFWPLFYPSLSHMSYELPLHTSHFSMLTGFMQNTFIGFSLSPRYFHHSCPKTIFLLLPRSVLFVELYFTTRQYDRIGELERIY